jgi:hypothetical protein
VVISSSSITAIAPGASQHRSSQHHSYDERQQQGGRDGDYNGHDVRARIAPAGQPNGGITQDMMSSSLTSH